MVIPMQGLKKYIPLGVIEMIFTISNNMDYTKKTLGELLSSANDIIKRHATGILKTLQRKNYCTQEYWNKLCSGCEYCKRTIGQD